MRPSWLVAAAIFSFVASSAVAEEPYEAFGSSGEPLLEATETVDGTTLAYPTVGAARLFSIRLTVEPGGRTLLHHHPVPTYVYVLEGEFELHYGDTVKTFKAGEALVEPLNKPTQVFNRGTVPLKMLVVQIESTEIEGAAPEHP
ncbi:MAG TPA: cupin domain-containing protein [Bauldia sp.]|nr:cupin domain-containing protein [Bauldia sp.]